MNEIKRFRRFRAGLDGVWASSNARERLVFAHIPKTAGTSIAQTMARQFDERKFHYDDRLTQEAVDNNLYFAGHLKFRSFVQYFSKTDMVFTFLRNPYDRLVSFYRSWADPEKEEMVNPALLNNNPHVKEALDIAQSSTLEEFLLSDHPYIQESIYNLQTRYLCFCSGNPKNSIDDVEFVRNNANLCLNAARNNLLSVYGFFGIVERMEESLELLSFSLGKSFVSRHANKSSKRFEISNQSSELIRQLNLIDVQLYDEAVAEFERRMEIMRAMKS